MQSFPVQRNPALLQERRWCPDATVMPGPLESPILEHLIDDVIDYHNAPTPERKLVIIDRMINRIHPQRPLVFSGYRENRQRMIFSNRESNVDQKDEAEIIAWIHGCPVNC